MTSPVTTRRGTSPSQSTVLSLLLYEHVKVEVSFERAWHLSAQNTMHASTMDAPLQVGYGKVGSLTKAPSEPPANSVKAAVPEIAALS